MQDLLWSVTAKAMLAVDLLRTSPLQMCSTIPGLLAVSRKTTLARSLRDMYGEGAWEIIPRTFKLPEELDAWAAWVSAHPEHDTGLWMLKNNKQVGSQKDAFVGQRTLRLPNSCGQRLMCTRHFAQGAIGSAQGLLSPDEQTRRVKLTLSRSCPILTARHRLAASAYRGGIQGELWG